MGLKQYQKPDCVCGLKKSFYIVRDKGKEKQYYICWPCYEKTLAADPA